MSNILQLICLLTGVILILRHLEVRDTILGRSGDVLFVAIDITGKSFQSV